MDRAIQVIKEHGELYVDRSVDRVIAEGIPLYVSMPRQVLHGLVAKLLGMVIDDVVHGTTTYSSHLRTIGSTRARTGAPIGEMIRGLDHGFQVISDHMSEVFGDDLAPRLWWESRKHQISYAGILAVNEAYYQTREALITQQNREILNLSAPILPLSQGILVLPIIGTLNDERATIIIQTLLDRIIELQCEVAIVDVTGIQAMDANTTSHLLRAAHAARLLGTQVILVGIRAEVARTFVHGENHFGDIPTLADLTQGLARAAGMRRKASRGLTSRNASVERSKDDR